MKRILSIAAIFEIGTAALALAVPAVLARLLLGAEPSAAGTVAMRCFGVAILGLGVSCWRSSPGSDVGRAPWRGMLAYNALIAILLAIAGGTGEARGVLLWPVVVLHAVIGLLLVGTGRRTAG